MTQAIFSIAADPTDTAYRRQGDPLAAPENASYQQPRGTTMTTTAFNTYDAALTRYYAAVDAAEQRAWGNNVDVDPSDDPAVIEAGRVVDEAFHALPPALVARVNSVLGD